MRSGRPRKDDADTMRVDYTKVSKHTWALRLRWREMGVLRVKVLRRVTDEEFKRIKASRAGFDEFKRQLIEDHKASLAGHL